MTGILITPSSVALKHEHPMKQPLTSILLKFNDGLYEGELVEIEQTCDGGAIDKQETGLRDGNSIWMELSSPYKR